VWCVRRAGLKRRAGHGFWAAAIIAALLGLVACTSWWDSESDQVRRAVIAHELDEPGLHVDDIVIRLSPSEFRADFDHGSRMIWLVSNALERQYREGEYFRLRDPGRSYLFVQDIRYDGARRRAKVKTVLYAALGETLTKELTLDKTSSGWEVVSERILEGA
jgi:hypothetical protein